ncbi:MAG TPA: hypothetical protein H9912_05230 [Candidatus Eisenbergiella stercorigallinarum]|uniref:Uncharacterized protein n=1 Tax=Candidatus Eisenbergiella stercorigallinarum TaxID=2838557 RepID=A0A9D2R018_9FIRM|nr:hypothetical protein [Candidatus Eisenbergiella stercorigallinarum]
MKHGKKTQYSKKSIFLFAAVLSALLLSACGGAKEEAASSDNTLSTGVTGQDDRRYLVQAVLVSYGGR